MTTVLEAMPECTVSKRSPGAEVAVVAMLWITVVLLVDAHGGLTTQRLLGLGTWCLLAVCVARETPLVRVQTGVVVAFATLVEYTCSPLLGVYVYRFHNVPAYVPPGHGLIYLAALTIGRAAFVRAHDRLLVGLVVVSGGLWSSYGVIVASRTDVLGAFWFVCLAAFLLWGPSRGLYVGAFLVVSYLELLGTSLGTWTWSLRDPTGMVAIGNPPSGAAGGYGWFDLAALCLGPSILAGWTRLSRRRRRLAPLPSVDVGP